MPEIQDHFSYSAVYFFLLIAVLIAIAFRLINFFVPVLPVKTEYKMGIRKAMPLIEFLCWFVFFIWGINYFVKYNMYFAIGLGAIVLLSMIWFAWYALRDLIAGIIIKSNRDLQVNETVDVGNYHGKIVRFGFRNLIMETESGKNIYIPYTMLIKREIVRSHPADKIQSHSFSLVTPKEKSAEQTILDIRAALLSLPWTSMIKDPVIRLEEEENGNFAFHITAYSIEKSYFVTIEKEIRGRFGGIYAGPLPG